MIRELEGKKPIKRMGQNFLVNKNIIKRIVQLSKISKKDNILEIGAGTGILTEEILNTGCNVLAVEKDPYLCKLLREKFKKEKKIEIIEKDILEIDSNILPKKYNIIANIPYYITSIIIRKFLEEEKQPEKMVLTIQKEVAKRICSSPPNMNILSLSVKYYGNPKIIMNISKNCFWPRPKVDSALIEIIPSKHPKEVDSSSFFKVIRAGFSSPRKQVINNLSFGLNIGKNKLIDFFLKNGYNPKKRPEDFSLDEWTSIAKIINNIV